MLNVEETQVECILEDFLRLSIQGSILSSESYQSIVYEFL